MVEDRRPPDVPMDTGYTYLIHCAFQLHIDLCKPKCFLGICVRKILHNGILYIDVKCDDYNAHNTGKREQLLQQQATIVCRENNS